MCSWGSNQKIDKFYKGAQNDTPWNKDLLWRYHVSKETKQAKVNTGELPSPDPAVKSRHPRLRMGITGTLIPDITPRHNSDVDGPSYQQRSLQSSQGRRRLSGESGHDTRSIASRARSTRSSALSTSSSSSSLSSSSSMRSIRLQDVQELLDSQSRLLKEKTADEIAVMRCALLEEARKREDAEKKINYLCEKLGVGLDDGHPE